nr:Chain B, p53 peptide [synthetic construct]
EPGGSR